jgi:hypothetical protein
MKLVTQLLDKEGKSLPIIVMSTQPFQININTVKVKALAFVIECIDKACPVGPESAPGQVPVPARVCLVVVIQAQKEFNIIFGTFLPERVDYVIVDLHLVDQPAGICRAPELQCQPCHDIIRGISAEIRDKIVIAFINAVGRYPG